MSSMEMNITPELQSERISWRQNTFDLNIIFKIQVGTDGFPPLKGTHMKYDVTGGINEVNFTLVLLRTGVFCCIGKFVLYSKNAPQDVHGC